MRSNRKKQSLLTKLTKSGKLKFIIFTIIFGILGAVYIVGSQAASTDSTLTITITGLPSGTEVHMTSSGITSENCIAAWFVTTGNPKVCSDNSGSGIGPGSLTWETSVNIGGSTYNITSMCLSTHQNVGGCTDGSEGSYPSVRINPGDNGKVTLLYTQNQPTSTNSPPATTSNKSTSSAPKTSTTSPSSSSSTTPLATNVNVPGQAPNPITSSDVRLNGSAISEEEVSIKAGEAVILSGQTIANGKVTLYIFSEPNKVSVTAASNGNWSYGLPKLADGKHHIEAEVTDSATGITSVRTTLFAFTINKSTNKNGTSLISGFAFVWIAAVAALVVGLVFLAYKKFYKK